MTVLMVAIYIHSGLHALPKNGLFSNKLVPLLNSFGHDY